MSTEVLIDLLQGMDLGSIQYLPSTESTNDDAHTWMDQGAPDMSIVIADEQTKGRGRFHRKWHTRAGAALACSLIIRPIERERNLLHLLSPMAGIAVASTLEKLYSIQPQIKWPNDVLLSGKKVCGILSETAWIGDDLRGVVIGTGINITPRAIPPMEELTFPATCIETEAGLTVDRWQLLSEFLTQMIFWRSQLGNDLFFDYWRQRLAFLGEEVEIRGAMGHELDGALEGIADNGDLLIRSYLGLIPVKVGDVHLRLRQK